MGVGFNPSFSRLLEGSQKDNPAEKTRKNEGSNLALGFADF
jgi:hypothetical protein